MIKYINIRDGEIIHEIHNPNGVLQCLCTFFKRFGTCRGVETVLNQSIYVPEYTPNELGPRFAPKETWDYLREEREKQENLMIERWQKAYGNQNS